MGVNGPGDVWNLDMEKDNVRLTSNVPYLIRAIRDWVVDNGLTPQLLVDAKVEGVQVPIRFVKDGRIVLNIDTNAVVDLYLGDDQISFKTRFQGQSMEVLLPVSSVMAIYPQEKPDQPFLLQDVSTRNTQEDRFDPEQAHGAGKNPGRPTLKLVE